MRRRRGSILIVVIGILGLLILLTVSVGRRANQELNLIKYSMQKMQARYLALAGFHYTLNQIRDDAADEISGKIDTLFMCGSKLAEEQLPENIFKNVKIGNGWFDVMTMAEPVRYGMSDEDGKMNLNALSLENYGIFTELLMVAGVQKEEAIRIASQTLDWMDEDQWSALSINVSQENQQPKAEGFFGLDKVQFPAKNRPMDDVYELMFINGMTPEIYAKIKPWVTVFPHQTDRMKINLATAPAAVLLALAKNYSGPMTGTSRDDAESLVRKLTAWRAGDDRIDGTIDDQQFVEGKMRLIMSEQAIYRGMTQNETKISRFLSFRVRAFEGTNKRQSHADAIIDRETLTVVSWRNN